MERRNVMKTANRQAICNVLLRKASEDKDIVVLCSDSRGSGSMTPFAEQYPELKANENYKQLMTELALTENQIAQYRNNYNQQVRAYNKLVRSFPTGFLLRVMNYQTIDTTYTDYDAPEDAPQNLFGGGDGD